MSRRASRLAESLSRLIIQEIQAGHTESAAALLKTYARIWATYSR